MAHQVISLAILAAWIGLGTLIARTSRAVGTAMLWYVLFGPLGLLLVGWGEWRRSKLGTAPASAGATGTGFPVQVEVDGLWLDGVLVTWSTAEGDWRGWVVYRLSGVEHGAWFSPSQVRRESGANGPEPLPG